MNIVLDCNLWLSLFNTLGRIPTDAELKASQLGAILVGARSNRKYQGERVTIVVSPHVITTCDYVAAKNGWAKSGEVSRWIFRIAKRLLDVNVAVIDTELEDYSALTARSKMTDGAEDAEDEAILRVAAKYDAVIATHDGDLLAVAPRRGINVVSPTALARALRL